MTKALFVLAALALAGCNSAPENKAAAADNMAEDNAMAADNGAAAVNMTAAVLALPDRQRNIVFVRALMDAGFKCDGVTKSERLEDMDGKPLWRASCNDGTSHMITITPDGTANIVSRSD